MQVFGAERAAAMLPFHGRGVAGTIRGWLTGSHLSVPSPRQIFTYVNGRYVRDKLVSHALVAGYSTLLMHGRYPAAVVFIEVPPEEIDVNVHPAKSEVRFRRGGAVHDLITRAVSERLRSQTAAAPAAPAAVTSDVSDPLAQMTIVLRPRRPDLPPRFGSHPVMGQSPPSLSACRRQRQVQASTRVRRRCHSRQRRHRQDTGRSPYCPPLLQGPQSRRASLVPYA